VTNFKPGITHIHMSRSLADHEPKVHQPTVVFKLKRKTSP